MNRYSGFRSLQTALAVRPTAHLPTYTATDAKNSTNSVTAAPYRIATSQFHR